MKKCETQFYIRDPDVCSQLENWLKTRIMHYEYIFMYAIRQPPEMDIGYALRSERRPAGSPGKGTIRILI